MPTRLRTVTLAVLTLVMLVTMAGCGVRDVQTLEVHSVVDIISTPTPEPTPTLTPVPVTPVPTPVPTPRIATADERASVCRGTNKQITECMAVAYFNWAGEQWKALDFIVMHESSYDIHACCGYGPCWGIPQACPGKKMRSEGSDWRDNVWTQVRWMLRYIKSRYGDPIGARSHWYRHHSY